jgi:hypothetical protein
MTVSFELVMPACPNCGGVRVNVAPEGADAPLYKCEPCKEVESPLVGIVSTDDAFVTEPLDELLAPPEEDDLPAPPEEPGAEDMAAIATHSLVELLPADFPLPTLIKFAPDTRIRQEADGDAAKLLGMQAIDETSQRVLEACLTKQREHKKGIEALFQEPCAIAYELHRNLTGLRGDWLSHTDSAIKTANERLLARQRQVEREAAEARRRAQEEADRQAREQAKREAEAAEKAQAPASVVQQLQQEAKTATAPPVSHGTGLFGGGGLRSSTVAENWKARLTATDRAADVLNPEMAKLSAEELHCVRSAMKAVLEGRAPVTIFEINWSWVNARAKADKKTFTIEGFVAEDIGSLRAKPGARRK